MGTFYFKNCVWQYFQVEYNSTNNYLKFLLKNIIINYFWMIRKLAHGISAYHFKSYLDGIEWKYISKNTCSSF